MSAPREADRVPFGSFYSHGLVRVAAALPRGAGRLGGIQRRARPGNGGFTSPPPSAVRAGSLRARVTMSDEVSTEAARELAALVAEGIPTIRGLTDGFRS